MPLFGDKGKKDGKGKSKKPKKKVAIIMTDAEINKLPSKERLTAFYKKYNPEKLNEVDKTLQKFKGREDELWELLEDKYKDKIKAHVKHIEDDDTEDSGEDDNSVSEEEDQPRSRAASPSIGGEAEERRKLREFYSLYNPEKVPEVDSTLDKFKGREDQMWELLHKKYAAQIKAHREKQAKEEEAKKKAEKQQKEEEKKEKREKNKSNSNLLQIPGENLEDKQSISSPPLSPPSPVAVMAAGLLDDPDAVNWSSRDRLAKFYERYNPKKSDEVDSTLAKFENNEEKLWTLLSEKYEDKIRAWRQANPSLLKRRASGMDSPGSPLLQRKLTADEDEIDFVMGAKGEVGEGHVRIWWEEKKKRLSVNILSCRHLVLSTDKDPDLYVKMQLLIDGKSSNVRKTKVAKKTREPVFDEVFEFTIRPKDRIHTYVQLQLLEWKAGSRDNYIGQMVFHLATPPMSELEAGEGAFFVLVALPPKSLPDTIFSPYKEKSRVEPEQKSQDGAGSYKDRLTTFYTMYNPEKLSSVDHTLAQYKGREDKLFWMLQRKYAKEIAQTKANATAADEFSHLPPTERLTAFYEKYDPAKVNQVEAMLKKYQGRETRLWRLLAHQYRDAIQEKTGVALRHTFHYDCESCGSTLEVPYARAANFHCPVCGAKAENLTSPDLEDTEDGHRHHVSHQEDIGHPGLSHTKSGVSLTHHRGQTLFRTVDFNCSSCKTTVQVPTGRAKNFVCPVCGTLTENVPIPKNDIDGDSDGEDAQEDDDLALKEDAYLNYSPFATEINLRVFPDDICDGFKGECEYDDEISWMCLTDQKRLCNRHHEIIHSHPENRDHVMLSLGDFRKCKELFLKLDEVNAALDKGEPPKVFCSQIAATADQVFDKMEAKIIYSLMRTSIDKYGPEYKVDFKKFVTDFAIFKKEDHHGDTTHNLGTTTKADLQRMKSEFEDDEGTMIHSDPFLAAKTRIGRFAIATRLSWAKCTRRLGLWENSLKRVQASHGASIAAYFHFSRWLFGLNFIISCMYFATIILPFLIGHQTGSPVDVSGLVVGFGMEKTWFFYGQYTPYVGKYRMDIAWVLVSGLMLLFSLIATIAHMSTGRGSFKNDTTIQLSAMIFNGLDLSVTNADMMEIQRNSLFTSIDQFRVQRRAELQLLTEGEEKTVPWTNRLTGLLFSGMFMGLNILLFYLLIQWENKSLIPDNSLSRWRYIIIPSIIAGCTMVAPKFIKFFVTSEQWPNEGDFFKHYFFRVLALRMCYILFILYAIFTSISQSNCPETDVGIIVYRLVIMDFASHFLVAVFVPSIAQAGRKCFASTFKVVPIQVSLRSIDVNMEMTDVSKQTRYAAPRHVAEKPHLKEFDIADNILDLMYRQALIMCGAPYCPMLPFLGAFFSFALFFTKRVEVTYFAKRPRFPMSVPRQNRFFNAGMVLTMLVTIIPYTFFLRRKPHCGPQINGGGTTSIVDMFLNQLQTSLPTWMEIVFNYLSNQVLLWMIILFFGMWSLTVRRRMKVTKRQIATTALRLKMESYERQKLIETYDVRLGGRDVRGREMFEKWIDSLGDLGLEYGPKLRAAGYNNLPKLCKLTNDQLEGLMGRLHVNPGGMKYVLDSLEAKRIDLI